MAEPNLEGLSLQGEEEEGFIFDFEEEGDEHLDFRWCLVGRFLCDRPIHVNSMQVRMANLWCPLMGVKIKEARSGLFLFHFSHPLDMEGVLKGGPWTFDNNMLIMEPVQLGMQIEQVPLNHAELWVQIHNLPVGLMKEKVGSTLANYIGEFVEYDKNNNTSFWRQYMCVRVKVDVRQPLKKDQRVKNKEGAWCKVNFKYEKLGVFCFVCGIMGHSENKCVVRFSMEHNDGRREWSADIRADPRRRGGRQTSRWLREEGGGAGEGVSGARVEQMQENGANPVEDPTRAEVAGKRQLSHENNAAITTRQNKKTVIIAQQTNPTVTLPTHQYNPSSHHYSQ
ncbi:hypothetical protein A2U01_0017451, partial [Trifolium medium]|nr:hypothetical protein [Trifolium medium]